MQRPPAPHDLLVALLLLQNSIERRSEAFFQPFGLTTAQFNILNLLAYRGGRLEQAQLIQMLLVGKSSISIVLNRMVREALVKREDHPKDRRQVVILLTAKGRALWAKISPRYEKSVEEVFGALPAKQRQPFLDSLEILYRALKRNGEASPDAKASPTLREMLAILSAAS